MKHRNIRPGQGRVKMGRMKMGRMETVELAAEGAGVTGAHGSLLRPTSLRVRSGETLVVAGDPKSGCTALALVLSGRLRPDQGRVLLNGASDPAEVRRRVTVVDAPDVTEPDEALKVRDVVAEGLSLAGQSSRRSAVRSWLEEHDEQQHAAERFENLPAANRTRLLLALATTRDDTAVLILDSPDRHGGDPSAWFAAARREAERGYAVIVLCDPRSASQLGIDTVLVGHNNSTVDTSESPPRTTENLPKAENLPTAQNLPPELNIQESR